MQCWKKNRVLKCTKWKNIYAWSQFWKISELVRDKMYFPESGSPLGSQLGITETFEMGRQLKSFAYYTYVIPVLNVLIIKQGW